MQSLSLLVGVVTRDVLLYYIIHIYLIVLLLEQLQGFSLAGVAGYQQIMYVFKELKLKFIIIRDNKTVWPSKTDSIPVHGDGYKPRSSKFRLRANAETSHSVRYDMVVVVVASIMGGGEKFLHGMVRSRKPPPLVPCTIAATTPFSYQGTWTIQYGYAAFNNIPEPQQKALTTSYIDGQANEQLNKYTPLPNPQGDCPRSMRSLAILLP